ncbi:MAG TPA: hypothetical protein VIC85_08855 [Ktedonobacterales bacterium]|jgi:hypothetical protein
MGKTIELTDEQDAILEHAANRRGEIAEDLLAEMIEGLREPSRPVYYTTYAFMRHLEMSFEEVRESARLADEFFPPDELDTDHDPSDTAENVSPDVADAHP